jgi:hypothetical protein
MAVFGWTISTLLQCTGIISQILSYFIFYTYILTCGLTGDNLQKTEMCCVCNVSVIKLHIDIMHLFGSNEIYIACVRV